MMRHLLNFLLLSKLKFSFKKINTKLYPIVCICIFSEEIETKYAGKLSKEISGPTYEVLAQVMKAIVNRKITTAANFKG